MKDLLDFYRTQVTLLWKWRGGPIGLLKRLAITLALRAMGPQARRVDPGRVIVQIDGLAHPLLTARYGSNLTGEQARSLLELIAASRKGRRHGTTDQARRSRGR